MTFGEGEMAPGCLRVGTERERRGAERDQGA